MIGLKSRPVRRFRVCLAASGGGHLRQILDMEEAWAPHDHFFVTEDTALGRSLAEKHRVQFVPHVALGQGRLGAPLRMLLAGWRNFWRSAAIVLRERPDVVISTGAGSVYACLLWARLIGAKVVVVESFARFDHPSAFGRLAAPLAHSHVIQSSALQKHWPKARVFDPLRVLDSERPAKQQLLFVTVGATLPFNRMVEMVAELKTRGHIAERVVIQTGEGGVAPEGFDVFESLPFGEMQTMMAEADIVVCHGGTGSLITALREGCRVVAVPRRFDRGEHYDDHQAEITGAFAARGLIAVADSVDELAAALDEVRSRVPVKATTDAARLTEFLKGELASWGGPVTNVPVGQVAESSS